MRILLIEPAKPDVSLAGEDVFIYEPLALEYVAAGVLDEHEVKILDMRLDKNLESVLADFRPHVVGATAFTVHVNGVKRLLERVKAQHADILTVVGGHHATVAPEDLKSPGIDLVVVGEGVFAFREIVGRLQRGEEFEGIPGVVPAGAGGQPVTNGGTHTDLDALPFPARSLTSQYRRQYYSEWMRPLASVRTSMGCPYRCNFCAQWKIAGGRYFTRNPAKVVEELSGIREEYIFFADDESLIDVPRMTSLAQLIKDAGINKRYFLYGRSDTIARHPELLRTWRAVGLERVFVGLEFVRDEDLSYVRKGSTSKDNERAVRILQDLGIDVYASFMLRPEFTRADFAALKEYCRHLKLNYASFAVLTPLPGTDLYREVRNQLITHNYDYFDFIHTLLPTRLPLEEFYAEYHDLYIKGIPFHRQLAFMKKYPLKELPSLIAKGRRFYGRLREAYKDYEN